LTENDRTSTNQNLRCVLVVDLFESVRLMQQSETTAIRAWQSFQDIVEQSILLTPDARIVKSLGDGLLLDFANAKSAVQAANTMHAGARQISAKFGLTFSLRVGINVCTIVQDSRDVYGNGVNLASRIAALAQPGQTVVTADARDNLVDGVDAHLVDMGLSYLKHYDEPVRTFHLGESGNSFDLQIEQNKLATIAIVSFSSLSSTDSVFAIGELIADGLISRLSGTKTINIISRLSSASLRDHQNAIQATKEHLAAQFVIHGTYAQMAGRLLISAQMTSTETGSVVWADRINCKTEDLLDADSVALGVLAQHVQDFFLNTSIQKTQENRLPSIEGYALMLGGIGLMHRANVGEFDKSKLVLEHLFERHPRVSDFRAWLAKWYVLRVLRGFSTDRQTEATRALSETARALDINPNNSLALAIEGYVYCQLTDQIDLASDRIKLAVSLNPNESLAWLIKSVISAAEGENLTAIDEAKHAQRLSPIDPIRYFYKMLIGNAYLVADNPKAAIVFCEDSIRLNRLHSPTVRILLTAQYELGLQDDARKTLDHLLSLEPALTLQKYISGGNPNNRNRKRCANALAGLGLRNN
jgi:adenylate cyclase